MNPMMPSDHPEFWNPKLRAPGCFNPAAAQSILPLTITHGCELTSVVGWPNLGFIDGEKHAKNNSIPVV